MSLENKEIMNNDENKCPNCGSYYTEEIDVYIYPEDCLTTNDLYSSTNESDDSSTIVKVSRVICGILFVIWLLNIIIAIIPFLGRLVRPYLAMNTFCLMISAIFVEMLESQKNVNSEKLTEDISLKKIKYKSRLKTYITRHQCYECNAVYDIDLSYEETNCPNFATYKEGEYLNCNDFTAEELTYLLRKNKDKPEEGTVVIPLKKGNIFIYIKEEDYIKCKNVNLNKDN